MTMADAKPTHKALEAYAQALELVTALHQITKQELDEETTGWLESESEITSPDDKQTLDLVLSAIYEGVFKSIQKAEELGPESLWNRAQTRLQDEAKKKRDKKQPKVKPAEVPILHQRLLRVYWMVRLATEELIEHHPHARLGKVLLAVEKNIREAFVETEDAIKLPVAMLRKKQWGLLAEHGMGLTVEEIYDLRPPRAVIEITGGKSLLIGIAIGLVIGLILGLILFNPHSP